MSPVATDHWVVFGDGNAAQILESKEYVDAHGLTMVRFILLPSERIEAIYDIADEQDEIGAIVMEYPKVHVIPLESGLYRSRYIIELDFKGNPTILSRRTQDLTEALKDNEKLLRSAEAAKDRAYDELRVEREHQRQALKQKTDAVLEVARARGRVEGEDLGLGGPGLPGGPGS